MTTRHERYERIDAAVFQTITAADWLRELRAARSAANALSEGIRKRLHELGMVSGGDCRSASSGDQKPA